MNCHSEYSAPVHPLEMSPRVARSLSFAIAAGVQSDIAAAYATWHHDIASVLVGVRAALRAGDVECARCECEMVKDRRLGLLLFLHDGLLCAALCERSAVGSDTRRCAALLGVGKELLALFAYQLCAVRIPVVLAKGRRVCHDKDVPAGDTRLQTALAVLAHLFECEASALDAAAPLSWQATNSMTVQR